MKYKFYEDFDKTKEPTGFLAKFKNLFWFIFFFFKNGKPSVVFRLGGGLGDHLLCTIVFAAIRIEYSKIWMMSFYPEIFERNPNVDKIVPDSWRVIKYCNFWSIPVTELSYTSFLDFGDKMCSPEYHIAVEILKKANLCGRFRIIPFYYDIKPFHYSVPYVCVQSADTLSSTVVQNKQWINSRFEEIILQISKNYTVIQLGLPKEKKLANTLDYTDDTNIAKAAGILKGAKFFLGQEGFLMHLTRAVNTRSVIIFGGRVKASQTGYKCNENIESSMLCSPCWQNNKCDYDRSCMKDISVSEVLSAIKRIELRLDDKIEEDIVEITNPLSS